MKGLFAITILLVVFMLSGVSIAGNTSDPGIQERIEEQQRRIDQGIASGELTPEEAARLQENLNRIKAEEAALKADGRLTARERARLHRELDINSAKIYKKKHNPRRRF